MLVSDIEKLNFEEECIINEEVSGDDMERGADVDSKWKADLEKSDVEWLLGHKGVETYFDRPILGMEKMGGSIWDVKGVAKEGENNAVAVSENSGIKIRGGVKDNPVACEEDKNSDKRLGKDNIVEAYDEMILEGGCTSENELHEVRVNSESGLEVHLNEEGILGSIEVVQVVQDSSVECLSARKMNDRKRGTKKGRRKAQTDILLKPCLALLKKRSTGATNKRNMIMKTVEASIEGYLERKSSMEEKQQKDEQSCKKTDETSKEAEETWEVAGDLQVKFMEGREEVVRKFREAEIRDKESA